MVTDAAITRESKISIGLMAVMIGGIMWLTTSALAVRNDVLPQVSAIRVSLDSLSKNVDKMASRIESLPTIQGVRATVFDEMKQVRGEWDGRFRDLENRVRDLEIHPVEERK